MLFFEDCLFHLDRTSTGKEKENMFFLLTHALTVKTPTELLLFFLAKRMRKLTFRANTTLDLGVV